MKLEHFEIICAGLLIPVILYVDLTIDSEYQKVVKNL
jgi:hypothetical protein